MSKRRRAWNAYYGGDSVSSFFANMRSLGMFYVTDPTFGAVGDFAHDDTGAINAAVTAASAVNGTVFFPPPSVAYKVTSEIMVAWTTPRLVGAATNRLSPTIRAAAVMRSVFAIRTTIGSPTPEDQAVNRGLFAHLTIDANSTVATPQATFAVISLGAEFSSFEDCRFINSLGAGLYIAQQQNAMTLGGVTPGGGGVAGVTVSEPNPNYSGVPGSNNSGTIVIKITGGGALGTALYQASFDGGATFQTPSLTLFAKTNIPVIANSKVITPTGLAMTFPAHTYAVNETYTFTYAFNLGDYGIGPGIGTAQGGISYFEDTWGQCGSVYITATKAGSYGGFNTQTVAGTIATTAGSQFLIGTGTNFTAMLGNESTRVMVQLDDGTPNPSTIYQGIILSDTVIAVEPGTEPIATQSGLQFAVGTWAGYYEDFDGTPQFTRGQCGNCSNGLIFNSGGGGPIVTSFVASSCAVIGGAFRSGATEIQNWFTASTAIAQWWFSPNSGGFARNPPLQGVNFGSPTSWSLESNGSYSPLSPGGASHWLSTQNLILSLSAVTAFTAASQAFPLPAQVSGATGVSSYIRFTANGDYLMSATPTIPVGKQGNVICLHNTGVSAHAITLQSDQLASSGLILDAPYITIAPQEMLWMMCTDQGKWKQFHHSVSAYATSNPAGNTGTGKRRIVTSNNTQTEAYKIEVVSSGVAAGTVLKLHVTAQSNLGHNWASWLDCFYASDILGNSTFVSGTARGSNAGAPPAGWAIAMDPTGTTPFVRVLVTGDNTVNPVTWIVVVQHLDPGQ